MEQAMTAVLEIRLFGGMAIRRGDAPISGFVSNKAPALLAYLAVTGRTHQRDVLAALLWGEMTDADAKNNLRQMLTNLRKLVDPTSSLPVRLLAGIRPFPTPSMLPNLNTICTRREVPTSSLASPPCSKPLSFTRVTSSLVFTCVTPRI
ncbi:MAG: hypothetical protein IPF56_10810 [Chloroflexi bacterium]|nr:hypothetical protein [Chloroflexota bacterium]